MEHIRALKEPIKACIRENWKEAVFLNIVAYTFIKLGMWSQCLFEDIWCSWKTPKFVILYLLIIELFIVDWKQWKKPYPSIS
jgi:hypothetical protein